MEDINARGGKKRILLIDKVHPERVPRRFSSHKALCDYFGFTESWLSQRIKRGKLEFGGYEMRLVDDFDDLEK